MSAAVTSSTVAAAPTMGLNWYPPRNKQEAD
jgi:hypothetical protein